MSTTSLINNKSVLQQKQLHTATELNDINALTSSSLLTVQSLARNATAINVLLMKNVSRADYNSVLTCSAKTPYFQLSINASVTLDINRKS